jgi:hypothetical protein
MIVNFRAREINQDTRKLTRTFKVNKRTLELIKKGTYNVTTNNEWLHGWKFLSDCSVTKISVCFKKPSSVLV